ncbi:dihydroorotase [Gracilibacillus orientalis]|uniref:Dihydroorotase n=1 Tax=Gracilibacillus orientalis TaxID=334253 RepID=A0A1I4HXU4_9BACI|nr:amidohydrolase/deacetylase family metallohydrolase [Gracilibacillus orientalis]SFL46992.1 dihydroorotase [Gracilibacillus orientalis]
MANKFALQNLKLLSGEKVDFVIDDRKISEIIPAGSSRLANSKNFSDCYVSSGWIDLHVHAFEDLQPYGDNIDEIGIKQGVTTIVDAGSCGADQLVDLVNNSRISKTNVFAFLNVSRIGLTRIDELSNMAWLDESKLMKVVEQYNDFIVGLKARISKSVVKEQALLPLKKARLFSEHTNLPLMIHIGSGPPSVEEILPLLKKHDIVTHFLNGKANNLFDRSGKPLPAFIDAINRGVHIDVGHGSASFSFSTGELAKRNDIYPFSISTDIYRKNRMNGPVYSLGMTASKFLYLGYTLEEVIHAITVEPAKRINRSDLGRIQVGDIANLSIFSVENTKVQLVDSDGESRVGNQIIKPRGVVINGEFITC